MGWRLPRNAAYDRIMTRFLELHERRDDSRYLLHGNQYAEELDTAVTECRSGVSRRASRRWEELRNQLRTLRSHFRLNRLEWRLPNGSTRCPMCAGALDARNSEYLKARYKKTWRWWYCNACGITGSFDSIPEPELFLPEARLEIFRSVKESR